MFTKSDLTNGWTQITFISHGHNIKKKLNCNTACESDQSMVCEMYRMTHLILFIFK